MRVLLIFPMADMQTGPAISYAFKRLGHKVQTVDAKLNPERSYATAVKFRPDLIFCSRTKELVKQIWLIRGHSIEWGWGEPRIAVWNVDSRANISDWKHLFPLVKLCDYHFVVDSKLIPEWKAVNPNTFWVPQGLQNELYKKPILITDEDREKYSCDVSWAGDIDSDGHTFRRPFIKAVSRMDIDFKLWGCRGNPRVYGEEHNKMVALSKINLGMSAFPENEDCVSVRDYKILGSGGFLLELDRLKIHDIFPIGTMDHYDYFPKSLVERITFYLKNEKLRKSIAERGYNLVRSEMTYTHRIRTILNIMGMEEKC